MQYQKNHDSLFNPLKKIGITGGTGAIGSDFVNYFLMMGYQIVVFTRSEDKVSNNPKLTYSYWDWERKIINGNLLRDCDYIFHLAGANIATKRWTRKYRKEIYNSRVKSAQFIIDTLNEGPVRTKVIIGASAVGYYGDDLRPDRGCTEEDPHATDFLGTLCYNLEQTLMQPMKHNIRVCTVRTGMVLSNHSGPFQEVKKLFQRNWVPIPGFGYQRVSWIHIEDLRRMYLFLIENESLSGPFNAVAPIPVTIFDLIYYSGQQLKAKFSMFCVPGFLIYLVKGRRACLVMNSYTVSANYIRKKGFHFRYRFLSDCYPGLVEGHQSKVGNPDVSSGKQKENDEIYNRKAYN